MVGVLGRARRRRYRGSYCRGDAQRHPLGARRAPAAGAAGIGNRHHGPSSPCCEGGAGLRRSAHQPGANRALAEP